MKVVEYFEYFTDFQKARHPPTQSAGWCFVFVFFFPWQTPTCAIYVQYQDESVFQRRGRDASIQMQTQQRARVCWQESSRCNRSLGAVHMP